MNFDLLEMLQRPAIVQEKKKYATFTLKEIGGPLEVLRWRSEQQAKEEMYRQRLLGRDHRIVAFEEELQEKLSTPTIHTTTWAEKLAFVAAEKKEIAKLRSQVIEFPPWEPIEEPKLRLSKRITNFFKQLWSNANL